MTETTNNTRRWIGWIILAAVLIGAAAVLFSGQKNLDQGDQAWRDYYCSKFPTDVSCK